MSGAPVSKEVHYRIRSDTGTVDGSPTWLAAEDTAASVTPGNTFRIRCSVENTGTAAETILQAGNGITRCGYAAGSFANYASWINGDTAASSDADATNVTVQRLTSGTGSFASGTAGYDEDESLSCNLNAGNFTEVEEGLKLTAGAGGTFGIGAGESITYAFGGLTNAATNTITITTPVSDGSDFQHGNQLGGTSQAVANSATISFTTSAAARSGNLVVVHVACDNNGTGDGDNSEVSGVTFNSVAMTKAVEFTNGQGSAQAGATSSIWWLQITGGDVASGATVTATFTTATTSGDANAIQAREYIVSSGKTVAVEATNGQAADGVIQPATIDCTTSNIECLRVVGQAGEGGPGNADRTVLVSDSTWGFWFTSGALVRSTGTTAANMCSCVMSTISTGTSAAVSATYGASSIDWALAYVAFRANAAVNLLGQACL